MRNFLSIGTLAVLFTASSAVQALNNAILKLNPNCNPSRDFCVAVAGDESVLDYPTVTLVGVAHDNLGRELKAVSAIRLPHAPSAPQFSLSPETARVYKLQDVKGQLESLESSDGKQHPLPSTCSVFLSLNDSKITNPGIRTILVSKNTGGTYSCRVTG